MLRIQPYSKVNRFSFNTARRRQALAPVRFGVGDPALTSYYLKRHNMKTGLNLQEALGEKPWEKLRAAMNYVLVKSPKSSQVASQPIGDTLKQLAQVVEDDAQNQPLDRLVAFQLMQLIAYGHKENSETNQATFKELKGNDTLVANFGDAVWDYLNVGGSSGSVIENAVVRSVMQSNAGSLNLGGRLKEVYAERSKLAENKQPGRFNKRWDNLFGEESNEFKTHSLLEEFHASVNPDRKRKPPRRLGRVPGGRRRQS